MKKIKSLICIVLVGLSVSSCKDFLTLMPLNEIVLENFWTNKSDVESVLLGAYSALEKSDCVIRMSIWGEMRSDNIVAGRNPSDDILQITKDNILETNSYTNYRCFYDVINRANTVLHFAPIVAEEDPNYTGAELMANKAEAIALRSLSYWYLIRAYKDVPYTTIPSIDDTHDFFIGQTPFDVILDSLIYDLESVEKFAVNRYAMQSANTGRFTRAAICAMLADMYLWKGDYEKCIKYCDWVIDRKQVEYEELLEKEGNDCTVELFGDETTQFPLYTEIFNTQNAGRMEGHSYNENFGSGNSFEVLFELPFDGDVSNSFVSSYYNGQNMDGGSLFANPQIGMSFEGRGNAVFPQEFDTRYYHSLRRNSSDGSTDFGIVKYAYESMQFNLLTGQVTGFQGTARRNTQANWIIYRYTDVLLMKAEALVQQSIQMGTEDSLSTAKRQLLDQAFSLVNAVNQRAIARSTTRPLKKSDYDSDDKMETLVLEERRRELMFEGKRWFDLVRMAIRDGNTKRLSALVLTKYDNSTVSAVRIKLTDMDALYFPLSKDEIKINDKLKQNPVYIEDEYIQKAK